MGSNNHIITSGVGAVSGVGGIKEACGVHTQAVPDRPTSEHAVSHLLWDAHRHSRSGENNAAQRLWGGRSEVTGSTEEVRSSVKEQRSPFRGRRGGGAKTRENHC